MSRIEEHKKIQQLVEAKVIVPGIYREVEGVKVYQPISQDEYEKIIESGDIDGLAYNTYSMGRGIFTIGENGEIINFKGVDSRLKDVDNIVVGKVNADIYNVSEMLGYEKSPYQIVVMSVPGYKSEIRVRGTSQLQNLINEKQKQEETKAKDKYGIIKFPKLEDITLFSDEFCKKVGLPRGIKITKEYLEQLIEDDKISRKRTGGTFGNYAYTCLKYMQEKGTPISMKNQTWEEYFSELSQEDYEKIKDIPNIESAIRKQDREYQLGAMFGQTTRILENPFRIMDLAYFVDHNKQEQVRSILDYTTSTQEQDYITYYAKTMAKNLAGFMNLNLSYNNWVHRQDFALSAEMCDDAYDDISQTLEYEKDIQEDDEHYKDIICNATRYYNQIYLFASNMKVIEDAYKMTGRVVPENYKKEFINTFIENLKNKEKILDRLDKDTGKDFKDILLLSEGKSAIQNFDGYEEYIIEFRELVKSKILEDKEVNGKFAEDFKKIKFFHDQKTDEFFKDVQTGRYSITEPQIGKATITTPTIKKREAQEQVTKDEKELNLEQGEIKE